MKEHVFKIGDSVRVVQYGSGCGTTTMDQVVTITELGKYSGQPGYKVSPKIGNCLSGHYDGFIGENSFQLVKKKTRNFDKRLLLICSLR